MARKIWSVFFCLLVVASAQAGKKTEKATLPERINLEVKKYTLANGLTVLIHVDTSAPVVSYQVWYKVGSKNERPGITGISHLFEHMMFKGSKNIGPEEHSRLIQANGGTDNAYTTFDNTTYFENLPSDKLELAIRLEAERQENLNITAENLASEREVVKEERRWRVDNSPYGALFEQALNLAFVAHPYHWHVIGFMSDLDNITLEDCKEYFRIHYAPNNATIVVAGDINPDETMKLIHKYYDHLPAQTPPASVGTVEPAQQGERRAKFHKVIQLEAFLVAYHIPEFGHPDIAPLQVLARILFKGQSSRMYQRMIYKDQIALFSEGDCFVLEHPGSFYVIVGMQPGHTLEKGEATAFEEIDKIKNQGVDPGELQKAKNQLEAEFIYSLQSVDDKAGQIGYYQTIGGDYNKLTSTLDKIRAVSAEDVVRVARQYLTEGNRTLVKLLPLPTDTQSGLPAQPKE